MKHGSFNAAITTGPPYTLCGRLQPCSPQLKPNVSLMMDMNTASGDSALHVDALLLIHKGKSRSRSEYSQIFAHLSHSCFKNLHHGQAGNEVMPPLYSCHFLQAKQSSARQGNCMHLCKDKSAHAILNMLGLFVVSFKERPWLVQGNLPVYEHIWYAIKAH